MFFLSAQKEPKNRPQTGGINYSVQTPLGATQSSYKNHGCNRFFDSVEDSNRITSKHLNLTTYLTY